MKNILQQQQIEIDIQGLAGKNDFQILLELRTARIFHAVPNFY